MKTINVCIGSACHLKGSYQVIECLQNLIKEDKSEEEFLVKAAFCLGHCMNGVSVKVDDGEVVSVCPKTAKEFYENLKKI